MGSAAVRGVDPEPPRKGHVPVSVLCLACTGGRAAVFKPVVLLLHWAAITSGGFLESCSVVMSD